MGASAGIASQAMTPEALEGLVMLLDESAAARGGMAVDAAQGFVAALLSGPRRIADSEWMPHVLGSGAAELAADARGRALLAELMQDTRAALETGRFEPLLPLLASAEEEPLPLPYGWCAGYAAGFALHGDEAPEAVGEDAVAANAIVPILSFLMYPPEDLHHPKDPAAHRAVAAELGPAAVTLFHWWRARR
jgi:yecA family protein